MVRKKYIPKGSRLQFKLGKSHEMLRWHGCCDTISIHKRALLSLRVMVTSMWDRYAHVHFDYVISGGDSLIAIAMALFIVRSGKTVIIRPCNVTGFGSAIDGLIVKRQSLYTKAVSDFVCRSLNIENNGMTQMELHKVIVDEINELNSSLSIPRCVISHEDNIFIADDDFGMYGGFRQLMCGLHCVFDRAISSDYWDFVRNGICEYSVGLNPGCVAICTFERMISTTRLSNDLLRDDHKGKNILVGDAISKSEDFLYIGEGERLSDIAFAFDSLKNIGVA